MKSPRSVALLATASLWLPFVCHAEDTIVLTYSERPPYMISVADDGPSGLTGTPAVAAFRQAGIPASFARLPTNRQLLMIKEAATRNCAIGWFWTPERETFAKFTKPIYRDKDWLVLANAAFANRGDATLEAVLRRHETRILVKDNFSYGTELDKLLARFKPTIAVSTAQSGKMVQSVSKGSVDMMFVSEDEGDYIMAHAGPEMNLRLLHFKDMPHGPDRHIMCSKNVPDEVIERLNKVITFK